MATKTKKTNKQKLGELITATNLREKSRAALASTQRLADTDAEKALKSKKRKSASAPPKSRKTEARLSALGAASLVLDETKTPMTATQLIEIMKARKLWTSPGGKTPEATLHAAITREIGTKGKASRFTKAGRGLFASSGKGAA